MCDERSATCGVRSAMWRCAVCHFVQPAGDGRAPECECTETRGLEGGKVHNGLRVGSTGSQVKALTAELEARDAALAQELVGRGADGAAVTAITRRASQVLSARPAAGTPSSRASARRDVVVLLVPWQFC